MNLYERARKDISRILSNPNGFTAPVVFTTPAGIVMDPVTWFFIDVNLDITPTTGMPIISRKVAGSVSLYAPDGITNQFPHGKRSQGKELLKVEGLTRKGTLENVSFSVHAGEVVGLAGLVGAGRTEVLRAIFGADSYDSGSITVDGKSIANDYNAKDIIGFQLQENRVVFKKLIECRKMTYRTGAEL